MYVARWNCDRCKAEIRSLDAGGFVFDGLLVTVARSNDDPLGWSAPADADLSSAAGVRRRSFDLCRPCAAVILVALGCVVVGVDNQPAEQPKLDG